jgi:hypothetical protein
MNNLVGYAHSTGQILIQSKLVRCTPRLDLPRHGRPPRGLA